MEIDFFCEVAWLKLGRGESGDRVPTTGVPPAQATDDKGKPQRVLSRSTPSASIPGDFRPNGKFKPDDDGRDAPRPPGRGNRLPAP